MRKSIILILVMLFSLSANAVKLNHRGEKMVSEIRIEYADSNARFPYSIVLGYDDATLEINSIVFDRVAIHPEISRLHRNKDGEITREDYYDGVLANRYTFKIDSEKRPIEMVWYEKNIYGKFVKAYTFTYQYGFNDYDLSILSIKEGDNWAAKRDLVKLENGNAYTYSNVVNLKTAKESTPKKSDRRLAYSELLNDINVDLYQIIGGYCTIGNSYMDLLGSNFISLVGWIPIWSKYLPLTIEKYKLNYIYDDGNISKVEVNSVYTDEKLYEISLSYLQ